METIIHTDINTRFVNLTMRHCKSYRLYVFQRVFSTIFKIKLFVSNVGRDRKMRNVFWRNKAQEICRNREFAGMKISGWDRIDLTQPTYPCVIIACPQRPSYGPSTGVAAKTGSLSVACVTYAL